MSQRINVHQEITDRIVTAIEAGTDKFKLPWHRPAGSIARPTNIASKKAYQGINVVSLWVEAQLKGYNTPVWGTYKQYSEAKCQVRNGEKASLVVFYKEIEFEKDGNAGKKDGDDTNTAWMARGYWVFNAEQVDGFQLPEKPPVAEIERNARVEAFIAATKADVRHGGHSAYYRPVTDYIQMPEAGLFTGTDTSSASEAYYATLLHETVHWTGHTSRLDRGLTSSISVEQRANEDLIAELGSAFLCADLSVSPHLRDDHAHYIANWLQALKGDKKAIFKAAAAANRAAEFLHGLQPKTEEAV